MNRALRQPRWWVVIIIVALFSLFTVGPINFVLDQDFLLRHLHIAPCCVAGLFVSFFTVLTILGIPGTILAVIGGIIFGFSWGVFWSTLGATLGALVGFWAARYLFRSYIERHWGHYKVLSNCKRWVKEKPFLLVLSIRFAPISPFTIVNYLFGLTSIHWIPYTIATFVGIIPGTMLYTWLGISGKDLLAGGDRWPFFLVIALLSLLTALPFWFKRQIFLPTSG